MYLITLSPATKFMIWYEFDVYFIVLSYYSKQA